jgi:hypothetical protein
MRNNWFVQGLITNGAWALLVLGTGVVVTLLARHASVWAVPALYGLAASTLVLISIVALKVVRSLPAKRPVIDLDNVEKEIRIWLDKFRTAVRNDPIPEAYFRFMVTMCVFRAMPISVPR